MKISSIFFTVLMVFGLHSAVFAMKAASPDCEKPLSENSNSEIVCNPNDKNLVKTSPNGPSGTEAASPEQLNPGTACRECETARYNKRLRENKSTVAPARTVEGSEGSNSKIQK